MNWNYLFPIDDGVKVEYVSILESYAKVIIFHEFVFQKNRVSIPYRLFQPMRGYILGIQARNTEIYPVVEVKQYNLLFIVRCYLP
jgi:hypothetical protein